MARELIGGNNINLSEPSAVQLAVNYSPSVVSVSVTHPVTPFLVPVVGTGSDELQPPAGYTLTAGGFAQSFAVGSALTVLPDGRVQVNQTGALMITGYADVSHSANNSTVAAAFHIYRAPDTIISPRAVHARLPNAGNIGNIAGTGVVAAVEGDVIGLAMASNNTGSVRIHSATLVYQWLG